MIQLEPNFGMRVQNEKNAIIIIFFVNKNITVQ